MLLAFESVADRKTPSRVKKNRKKGATSSGLSSQVISMTRVTKPVVSTMTVMTDTPEKQQNAVL